MMSLNNFSKDTVWASNVNLLLLLLLRNLVLNQNESQLLYCITDKYVCFKRYLRCKLFPTILPFLYYFILELFNVIICFSIECT